MPGQYKEHKEMNFAGIASEILDFWNKNKVFERSVTNRDGFPTFTFYEGPPSANGTPGIHHVMGRTVKDIFCRYKTLQGFQVNRKGGWDTHGLPVELQVEKALGITKDDIGKKISIEEYNQKCRETVMMYKDQWDDLTLKMGYWVDLDHPYITYKKEYVESLWWLLKQLYDKKLLYKGYTIQPYSPSDGTGLSSHELNQPGCYKEVKDTSIVGQFKVIKNDKSKALFEGVDGDVYILAWTTTPWTLPSNTALVVGNNIDYVLVTTKNKYTDKPVNVILAKDRFSAYFTEKDKAVVHPKTFKGKELVGVQYEQLMPYVQPLYDADKAFRVVNGDFVTTEDGTGIVHSSPTFGADDFRVSKQNGIPPMTVRDAAGNEVPTVDKKGKFISQIGLKLAEGVAKYKIKTHKTLSPDDFYVKNYTDEDESNPDYKTTDVIISIILKEENKAFDVRKYEHTYPHSWRTDKPVLYYPLDAWFIKTTACKDRMVELNKTINWKPESTGTGRFGNWLENLVDWNLSRSRFWGTPLPIWRSEDGIEEICIGSFEELKQQIEIAKKEISKLAEFRESEIRIISNILKSKNWDDSVKAELNYDYVLQTYRELSKNQVIKIVQDQTLPEDLHRPYVDEIILVKNNKILFREPDLIDVWFDSGAMPYAQWHYPFENKEVFKNAFPADYIAEGVDQTRGWFFTLHAIAVMLFDSVAFKNVISNGLVLDKDGNKMSKRKGNVVNPFEALTKYGPDVIRWYMIENAPPWDNLKFDEDGVKETQRRFFGTLLNTYSFFALYANIDKYRFSEGTKGTPSILDNWILSKLQSLIEEVTKAYDEYDPTKAARAIQGFVNDHLSNWYVRLNRKRFWVGKMSDDKAAAYTTLYTCLLEITKLMSPVAPFFSDWIFKNLTEKDSVHLSEFSKANKALVNEDLELSMNYAQQICSLVHSIRKNAKVKVRTPLNKVLLPVLDDQFARRVKTVEDIICAEVNVKSIEYIDDTSDLLVKKVKPNFAKLGKKYGPKMKEVTAVINAFSKQDISAIEKSGTLSRDGFDLALEDVLISSEDVPGWAVASENGVTVALDINITEELKKEGIARDFVNRIQNLRKELGLEVLDKISIEVEKDGEVVTSALTQFREYISTETQALSFELKDKLADASEIDMDDFSLRVKISRK